MASATLSLSGFGLPASPQARRLIPLLPQIVANPYDWTAAKLARAIGTKVNTASGYLRKIQDNLVNNSIIPSQSIDAKAREVALRVCENQIEQATRIDDLADRAIDQLAEKADAGELSIGDLERLTRLRKTHWEHLKDLSGRSLAEKVILAKVKGDAAGQAIGRALIDSTAAELGGEIWDAETVPVMTDQEDSGDSSPETD